MFGSTRKPEESQKSSALSAGSNSLNALVKGTRVDGTLQCENDLRVDGTIRGNLKSTAKVIIGPNGSVEGEIRCQNAVIEGKFRGILHVADLLNVRETAVIDGDVFCQRLSVQSGAQFNIICKMGQSGATAPAALPTSTATKTSAATKIVHANATEVVVA